MTVGIVGAGQLGRMLALAGYPLGLDFLCLDPARDAPAGKVAPLLHGAFTDAALLRQLARACEVVTFDWENVSVASLRTMQRAHGARICPPVAALATGQDRVAEKRLFEKLHIPTTRWRAVDSRAQLARAVAAIGLPGVLKTRRLGYDGKGQAVIGTAAEADHAWHKLGGVPLIYEERVPFDCEVSIIGARSLRGEIVVYPLCGNVHAHGILRLTRAPYGARAWQARAATYLTRLLQPFPLCRHPHHRVLRAPRPADRQRDRTAGAQLRALDHRGRGHQPVREPPARDPRSAARQHPRARPQRHDQPHRQHPGARRGCLRPRGCTCTTTASSPAPGARWGM